jgi:lambda repressor-like predicted transcriptional regulator
VSDEKTTPERFPILTGPGINRNNPTIPWAVIAPHERQAKLNHGGQTLRRLADRGGLSWTEAEAVLMDREFPWREKINEDAARLRVLALCGEAANA